MVTAEKIIEYVLYTPHNPNKAVLKSLLEDYLEDSGSGGGGGVIIEEKIFVLPDINGSTTYEPADPEPGDTVTITPTPDSGYKVTEVVVVDTEGNQIEVTDNGDGTYSYVQPEGSAIPVIGYGSETAIGPDDTVIFDGGGVSGW